ncbi:protein GVQW3-like [Galleria mellonella]|uniref:Protein GVQW3-like n=1 Tax=Galleria mellonella TaxID=7137 RepID=A0ABM3MAP5_GALME|nr:protein GVQW3-like [Galleria mellonella]
MEKRNQEQRVAIKFCAKLGETASETYAKIVKVHGDSALSRAQVFRWHTEFKEGRESVEDEARSGRPVEVRTDTNAQRVRALIREDRRLTVRMLASELGMNRETVRQILTDDFRMRKLCAKMVPKNLSEEQKQHRMTVAEDCLEQVGNDPTLLDRVITGDESWFFQYDPETKRQSSQWLSPHAPARKSSHEQVEGQTVNQVYYRQVLERLRKRVNRVRPNIARNWILHHDNAPCHTALSVSQYLASKGIAVLQQPPYSSDMSPCDFFLLPRTKSVVKGTHFESIEDI